jgi:hypothetical protein
MSRRSDAEQKAPPGETQKISFEVLETGSHFSSFWSAATAAWGAFRAPVETGTGCVRCLIPILLFGGFGYAHI